MGRLDRVRYLPPPPHLLPKNHLPLPPLPQRPHRPPPLPPPAPKSLIRIPRQDLPHQTRRPVLARYAPHIMSSHPQVIVPHRGAHPTCFRLAQDLLPEFLRQRRGGGGGLDGGRRGAGGGGVREETQDLALELPGPLGGQERPVLFDWGLRLVRRGLPLVALRLPSNPTGRSLLDLVVQRAIPGPHARSLSVRSLVSPLEHRQPEFRRRSLVHQCGACGAGSVSALEGGGAELRAGGSTRPCGGCGGGLGAAGADGSLDAAPGVEVAVGGGFVLGLVALSALLSDSCRFGREE